MSFARRLLGSWSSVGLMAALLPTLFAAPQSHAGLQNPAATSDPGTAKSDAPKSDTPGSDSPKLESTKPSGTDPAPYLDIMRSRLNGLGLTEAQTTKVDALFAKAKEQLKELGGDGKEVNRDERATKLREVFTGIREGLTEILTEEQASKAKELFARPAAATGRPGGAGTTLETVMQNLQKLDLTAEQKTKIKSLFEETRTAIEALRKDGQAAGSDRAALREKATKIGQETRTKLGEILTPEQSAKLKELMSETKASTTQRRPAAKS